MSAVKRFEMVEDRASLYERHAEEDVWHADHQWAILCFDYAELVSEGVDLFDSICSLDNDWRLGMFGEAIPYDRAFERRIEGLFARWVQTSEKIVGMYDGPLGDEFRSRGFDTEDVEKLRCYCREVRESMRDDREFFATDKTFDMAENALRQHAANETQDMDCLAPGSQE